MSLKQAYEKARNRPKTLWKGPEEDGITNSLLKKFLSCRERFRQLVVYGRRSHEPGFNYRMEYGSLWHECEDSYAKGNDWKESLHLLAEKYYSDFPQERAMVYRWVQICEMQYEIYLNHREKFLPKDEELLEAETPFMVHYRLPNGRKVVLRGKRDALYLKQDGSMVLQENKTKGDIDEVAIRRDLQFDLQTMLYCLTSTMIYDYPISGVYYNVVKRPLSGGKGTIRQKKPSKSNPAGESDSEYLSRLRDILEEESDSHFLRFNVGISPNDLKTFTKTFLDPVLMDLCRWWDWVSEKPDDPFRKGNTVHWRTPYMVNPVFEGYFDGVNNLLDQGIMSGLEVVDTLFPELK